MKPLLSRIALPRACTTVVRAHRCASTPVRSVKATNITQTSIEATRVPVAASS